MLQEEVAGPRPLRRLGPGGGTRASAASSIEHTKSLDTTISGLNMSINQLNLPGRDDMRMTKMSFSSREEEADYARSLNEKNRPMLLRYLLFPIPVALTEALFFVLSLDGMKDVHRLALCIRGFLVLETLVAWLLVWRRKAIECANVVLVWAVLSSLLLVCYSSMALSKIMGVYDEVVDAFTIDGRVVHNDAAIVLALQIVCSSALVFIQVRSSRSWILPLAQAVFYGATSFLRLNALTMSANVLNVLFLVILNALVWMGCWNNELVERERWNQHWLLSREIARQRTLNDLKTIQLAQVSEHMEAFTGAELPGPMTVTPTAVKFFEDTAQAPPPKLLEPSDKSTSEPNSWLTSLLSNCVADEARLHSMATRIREADYDIGMFFEDALATFPELGLFHSLKSSDVAMSARSAEEEYQRTVGALFGVYFLLRMDMDGKQGWCYGMNDSFSIHGNAQDSVPKREAFMEKADWQSMALLASAAVGSSQQRIEAMFCLTAFHDIMKVPGLCPCVAERHAPYHGYPAGTVINDHDLALAYVLEHYPDVLPSFRVLPAESQRTVLFTQGKMEFNHGWFVQAEAPPGAMLRNLRSVLAKAKADDIAFYFFHWLTDLSGAEGRPMAGAEKFVLKFPIPVLGEFMWSIPFLQGLLEKPEVAVMEEYLKAKWARTFPTAPVPKDSSYVALLRLTVMAQANSSLVVERFQELPAACKEVLSAELACTGAYGQHFEHVRSRGGPALLVYYGPALLQCCSGAEEVGVALRLLAGVFAAGRALWPLGRGQEAKTVKLEIGQLVRAGKEPRGADSVWVLLPLNRVEARVEALEPCEVNAMNMVCERYWVIDMACEQRTGSWKKTGVIV